MPLIPTNVDPIIETKYKAAMPTVRVGNWCAEPDTSVKMFELTDVTALESEGVFNSALAVYSMSGLLVSCSGAFT